MRNRRKLSRRAMLGAPAGALALLMSQNVLAAERNDIIAEVLVTAQKRTENLQDVPTSVSVFDDEKLTQLHATRLTDYAAYLPGVNVNSGGSPGQTTVTLRGIAPVGPGSVIGTYIDDTPLGSSSNYARATGFALDLMPYDIQRVEVLRGPQGTLYGAGSMGGLLKYVLHDPNLQKLEVRGGMETSSIRNADDMGWGARAALNAPIVAGKLAVRASYFNQETPGFVDNVATGEQGENDVSQNGGRAALLWQPTESLSIQLGGVWQRLESDNNGTMTLALTGTNPPTGRVNLGDLKTSHPIEEPFRKDVDYYSATLDWDLGWANFVSASSFSQTHTDQHQDASQTFGMLYPLLTGGAVSAGLNHFNITLDLERWTQELRLASGTEGRVEWLVGAFYTEEKSRNVQRSSALDNNYRPIPVFAPLFAFASLPTDYQEMAVFGDVTYKFSEMFDLTAGVRWAENEQQFRQISGGAILPVANNPGESSEDVITYMISPRLHLSEDTMVYARVASGYRPGGPNIVLPGVPPQVDSDELINYELGLKTQFLERRALMNLAVFLVDWTDIQQTQAFGGVSALDNAGDAQSRGVELESAFSVAEGLRLGLNLGYTDATLESNPPTLRNKVGAPLPAVPEWSGAVTADYSFDIGSYPAHIGGGYRYVGEQQSQVVTTTNNLSYTLPSYKALDLNADVSFDRVTLRLFAKNVTDERAFTGGGAIVNGLNQAAQVDVNILQPRTFGVSVDVEF